MRITIRARTLERVHAEAGYMLALGPAFYRLSSCKQGESIYGFRGYLSRFRLKQAPFVSGSLNALNYHNDYGLQKTTACGRLHA